MEEYAAATLIDARGLRCPWPALRLARAMRMAPGDAAGAGASFLLLADDPAAPREIAALAAEHGWRAEPVEGGMRVTRPRAADAENSAR